MKKVYEVKNMTKSDNVKTLGVFKTRFDAKKYIDDDLPKYNYLYKNFHCSRKAGLGRSNVRTKNKYKIIKVEISNFSYFIKNVFGGLE